MTSPTLRVGSIDIGSNSVRLLVAQLGGSNGLKRLLGQRAMPRLGTGVRSSGMLSQEAIEHTVLIVKEFLQLARALGVKKILAAGTSAVREACNRDLLLQRLEQSTGLRVRVLSGEEEALWAVEGIRWVWSSPLERWLAVDIGGGSSEFALVQGHGVLGVLSVPLGMVKLTEEYLLEDPPSEKALKNCRDEVRSVLKEAFLHLGLDGIKGLAVAGTAGTITTLAALEREMKNYEGDVIHGANLEKTAVEKWLSRLCAMQSKARRLLPGMEPGREDVIVAGAVIVDEFLELAGAESMMVSDHGLLEGMARMAPEWGQALV